VADKHPRRADRDVRLGGLQVVRGRKGPGSERTMAQEGGKEGGDDVMLMFPKAAIKRIMKIDQDTKQVASVSIFAQPRSLLLPTHSPP
jgi:hypothetical protein